MNEPRYTLAATTFEGTPIQENGETVALSHSLDKARALVATLNAAEQMREAREAILRNPSVNPTETAKAAIAAAKGATVSENYYEPWTVHPFGNSEAAFDVDGGFVGKFAGPRDAFRSVACVNACAGIADPAAHLEALRAENAKLAARVAELEADKARLDWLERIDTQKYMFKNWIGGGGTLRAAIDGARKEQP